mgnify:CR=1 FL=1
MHLNYKQCVYMISPCLLKVNDTTCNKHLDSNSATSNIK